MKASPRLQRVRTTPTPTPTPLVEPTPKLHRCGAYFEGEVDRGGHEPRMVQCQKRPHRYGLHVAIVNNAPLWWSGRKIAERRRAMPTEVQAELKLLKPEASQLEAGDVSPEPGSDTSHVGRTIVGVIVGGPGQDASARRQQAVERGFTGDGCGECGSMSMRRNGSGCLICYGCGATTGCS